MKRQWSTIKILLIAFLKRQWSTIKILLWIIFCLSVTALIVLFVLNFKYLSTHFTENNPHGALFKVVLTIIAGIIAIVALYYNHRRVTAMEKGNVDTRFNDAVGHLGNENPAVVLGGIHALHQIAVKHKNYTLVIHNLFCSYLRENSAKIYEENEKKTPDKCPVIIQTLIDYLFKPYNEKENVYIDFNSDLSFCVLKNCNLGNATLTECDFYRATLTNCKFLITDKQIDKHPLSGNAVLIKCNFYRTSLNNCNFLDAALRKCDFKNATLSKCDFKKTIIDDCVFISEINNYNDAKLIDCRHLETVTLIGDTKLPPNETSKTQT